MANQAVWTTGEADGKKEVTFHVGDTVRVHYKLIEKEKVSGKTKREVHEETHERTQAFEGIVLSIRGSGPNAMFTVRRIGVGAIAIERIFPLVSPWIKKLEVKKLGDVRRAKLYYLRWRKGKAATRINEAPIHVRPAASA
ncbi:50S ribosomal protein L19 [Candidatus Gottesmanbacteria bacterium RIFCSPLOWO2_01_FULL_48_11]|uniref:Large ribosomal subunit protein bL19 n=2 Tax=Candidatus Gottesmaniibacteriota TaxID=1752720 RepID=A0A0G1TYI6_9BACT|nr:MAG: 50S ribosomal protein L19 [Candidatus Gottesmanbacteria bacterium GW2011_GWA2_47_9]OGG27161.1 MAG: 50S ribosomal protein L19 [Candidatus Gottesmanbacteria bacterium RIFCSPLOWO2_01_FULL_48_11]